MGKVGLGAGAAVRRREMALDSGQGGEREEGEKWPLAPGHQGPKSAKEGAVYARVVKF